MKCLLLARGPGFRRFGTFRLTTFQAAPEQTWAEHSLARCAALGQVQKTETYLGMVLASIFCKLATLCRCMGDDGL